MKTVELQGSGLQSPLVLGTADMGTSIPEARAFAILDRFAEAGGTLLDTAYVYASWMPGGEGKSESTLGAWMRQAGALQQIAVATKGGHHDLKTGEKRLTRDHLRTELSISLERLGLPRVALYWMHRDDPNQPVADVLEWIWELMDEGLFLAYGFSHWAPDRQDEALRLAQLAGRPGPAGHQIGWSLARAEHGRFPAGDVLFMNDTLFQYHKTTRIPVFGFEAQARGFFAGKLRGQSQPPDGPLHYLWQKYGTPENERRLKAAETIAEQRNATANQVALAYLWHQPFPTFAIAGPTRVEQLNDSLGALALNLSESDLATLRGSYLY